jgi:hypothetical protein
VSRPLSPLAELLSGRVGWQTVATPSTWEFVSRNAGPEGVAPLVAYSARNHLQGAERAWCDQVLTRSWRRHDSAVQQLSGMVELLRAADIETIALKGPALAHRVYSPPFLRKPSGDLDLAVRPDDLDRAVQVLQNDGYSLVVSFRDAKMTSHHVVLRHESRRPVELHFRLSHGVLGIPVEEFFRRAVSCELPSGATVRVLAPADELMHLILHVVNDRFATLFHSYEVLRLWRAAPAEVQAQVIQQAVSHHFAGVFTLCNIGIRSIWGEPLLTDGTSLPETWLHRWLNEETFLEMAQTAGHGREQPLKKRLRGRWLDLQTTDRPSDALERIRSLVQVALGQIRRRNWDSGRISA